MARAKARRTIKQCKRTSWRQFVPRLNSRSSVKKTWETVRRIEGKNSSITVTHLNSAGTEKTTKKESAYDTTWKYGILNDLYSFGIRGRLADFISTFLNDRQFKVRVGDIFSDSHEQEMGVPQGSILSVTLFSVKINSIVKSVCPGVECFLYVDDFCICYRSKHMYTIERQLQQVLNNLSKWSRENGF